MPESQPEKLRFIKYGVGVALSLMISAAIGITLGAGRAPAQPTEASPPVVATDASRPDVGPATESQKLIGFAQLGAFDLVLQELEKHKDPASKLEASLVTDITRFRTQQSDYAKTRQELYEKAIARIKKMDDAGRFDDAMVAAIEAHTIAEDPNQLFKNEDVAKAVNGAKLAASTAAAQGKWLEALNYYRLLDALFDDHASFREQLSDANQHARILRIYAPDEYEKQLKERITRLKEKRKIDADEAKAVKAGQANVENASPALEGTDKADADKVTEKAASNEDLDNIRLEKEPWQKTLDGVEPAMIRQVFGQASRQHIENKRYFPLIQGAIKALHNITSEPALKASFPGMGDPEKVTAFVAQLDTINNRLTQAGMDLNTAQANGMIEDLLKANRETINLPEQVMIYEMTEGGLQSLDEFSSVIWPREKDMFDRTLVGRFYGVGILISKKDDRVLVVTPLEDSPALKAGIKAGDVIQKVDGQDTLGWSLDEVVRRITGQKDTPVTLTIERKAVPEPLVFKLIRAEIPIESVRGWERKPKGGWSYWIDEDSRIAYIRLSQFIRSSAQDMDNAITAMEKNSGPINGLILDLRGNPGGLLEAAVDVSNRFIPVGPIVSTVGNEGQKNQEFKARAQSTYKNFFPVVVLVNEGSASASEIVAGALQDYRRALIVGARTYGKGSVQDVMPFDNNRALLKLTTQYYMLPKGRIIHRKPDARTWGVEPDLKVMVTPEQSTKAFELRQEADIIASNADETQPADADGKKQNQEPPKVSDLITKGLDPQLIAALLILKTEVYAESIKEKPAAVKAAAEPVKPAP